MESSTSATYALRFDVEYPDRELNRLTSFFRIIVILPILVVLMALSGSTTTTTSTWTGEASETVVTTTTTTGGILFLATLLMILFRQKYPRWWFDWNLGLTRFANRVGTYMFLLRDEYPATDEEQAVRLELDYPDVKRDLMRGMPLVKWLLAVPHYIVLLFLGIGVLGAVIIAWFAILFTGRYPQALFDYVVGVFRWGLRVEAYALLLVTDQYPPFSLK